MVGGHHTALFDCVIQQRQSGSSTMGTADLQAHFFQNPRHAVAHRRGGSQAQVHNAEGHAQAAGGLHAHQLSHPGDLEGGLLDGFCHHVKGLPLDLLQRMVHNTGAGHTHIDDALRLTDTVERTCHKGVILHCVGKYHQLGAAHAAVVLGQCGGFFDDASHFCYGIHIDARLGRANIDAGAHPLGGSQCLGDGANQLPVAGGSALLHQGRKAADEVHAAGLGSGIQRLCNLHIAVGLASAGDQGNGGDGNPLVDNGNAKLRFNLLTHRHQILGEPGNLIINLLAADLQIRVAAV